MNDQSNGTYQQGNYLLGKAATSPTMPRPIRAEVAMVPDERGIGSELTPPRQEIYEKYDIQRELLDLVNQESVFRYRIKDRHASLGYLKHIADRFFFQAPYSTI